MKKPVASLILGSGNFKGAAIAYAEERILELVKQLEIEDDIYKIKYLQGSIAELRRLTKAADTAMNIWKQEERTQNGSTNSG